MDKYGKELSADEYKRLNYEEQQVYLRSLLDDSDSENDIYQDNGSDDEWVPQADINVTNGQIDNDASDVEDVFVDQDVQIELNSDDEDELSDDGMDDIEESVSEPQCFHGKDNTVWNYRPSKSSQTLTHNIFRKKPGPVKSTANLSPRDVFKCILSDAMGDIIIRQTNRKAINFCNKWNGENKNKAQKIWRKVTKEEFDGYIGILITAGVRYSSKEHVRELWKCDAYPLYRATLSITRFCEITRFIRFDNDETRAERLLTDKAAAISDIWLMLNQNLRAHYVPSDCVVIDEQLFPYRGRTRFTQYMPSKPAKYGIKIWWICDAETSYPLTGQIYTGKPVTGREKNQGERVVQDLAILYKNSGRNVTMDNFFMSLPIAHLLLSWDLSVVGTMKKNKACIPVKMLPNREREVMSSIFGFSEDGKVTLCSYVPKKGKCVVLLSTMHNDSSISGTQNKPEIINYYNSTKSGVDNMDKMVTHYSTKRRTLRWTLSLFYNAIDIACLASYIIYTKNNPSAKKSSHSRRTFYQELGRSLAMPMIEIRSQMTHTIKIFSTKNAVEAILGHAVARNMEASNITAQIHVKKPKPVVGSCYVCRIQSKKQRKTRKCCCVCNSPICDEHCETITKCHTCEL